MTWKERAEFIEKWPWSKTTVAAGILVFIGAAAGLAVTTAILLFLPTLRPAATEQWLVREALDGYDTTLLWAAAFAGVGAVSLVGKRAATKPGVIDAELNAAIATGRTRELPIPVGEGASAMDPKPNELRARATDAPALPAMPTLGLYNAADVVAVSGGAAAGDDERTDDEVVR